MSQQLRIFGRIVLVAVLCGMVGAAPAAAEVSSAGRGERVVVRSDELSQDIRSAVYVVNRYWARHWSQFFPGWYDPPTVVGSYNGNSARRPVCAGQPLYSYNASYCMQQHFIAWDINLVSFSALKGRACGSSPCMGCTDQAASSAA
ncbi:hypothetical protein [Streptosporangium sp. NBC_01756]|uniref:hypothetical protein n=1 Tax=Streptosporangium sp. NBC_01756 TaxID=2975950 RepID=UPI002DD923B3|nr:hypothetical protein [Streptosporangium sp. NBC_01756]WSC87346.1 hypothetical protein OIE48_03790 [Streptosporangium sp. NBC_01756]